MHAPPLGSRKIALLTAVSTIVFGSALLLFHNLTVAAVSTLLTLAVALAQRIPLRYTLDDTGATVRIASFVWLEVEWTAVKCVSSVRGGVKLSAFENPAMATLESRRGIRLRYPKAMAAIVESEIRRRRSA